MSLVRSITTFALGASLAIAASAPAAAQTPAAAPAPSQFFPVPVASRWLEWDYVVAPNGPVRIAARLETVHADRIVSTTPSVAKGRFTNYLNDRSTAVLSRDGHGRVLETEIVRPPVRPRVFAWYDFSAQPWTPYATGLERARFAGVTIQNDSEPVCVVTQAGVFENCKRLRFETPGVADAGITTETFAPGVGLVARSAATVWGTWETRLRNLRTSGGFSLVGRRPLDASLDVNPKSIVIGGAPRPDWMPAPHYTITAKLHLTAQAVTAVYEGREPATFYAIDGSGRLFAKLSATRRNLARVGPSGFDYQVTFDLRSLPIGKVTVAAETNLVPGAAPATAQIEVIAGE